MHTLLFLEPGHFHAALTLRVANPRVGDDVFVYARDGAELRDFLALVERFNQRVEQPTAWRPRVTTSDDPLARLIEERPGDIVVLAGRNGGKARTIRRLHAAGLHVLADKPWLVEPEDLAHLRASLAGWPLVMEIMTGRHDTHARVCQALVGVREVFGDFRAQAPALDQQSVHHLEKLVDGMPLRRPWWFFDVRVQGSGPVDIPTHLVDQAQWLVEGAGLPLHAPQLLRARAWPTPVPVGAFCRITGERAFPPGLRPFVSDDVLEYLGNAELLYRIGEVTAQLATRWDPSLPAGGADAHRTLVHGTRADISLEQGAHTGHRRRVFVRPGHDDGSVAKALTDVVSGGRIGVSGRVETVGAGLYEVIPAEVDIGHESHFARVLDDFVSTIEERRWPAARAECTRAKYTFLAEAVARTRADHVMLTRSQESSR